MVFPSKFPDHNQIPSLLPLFTMRDHSTILSGRDDASESVGEEHPEFGFHLICNYALSSFAKMRVYFTSRKRTYKTFCNPFPLSLMRTNSITIFGIIAVETKNLDIGRMLLGKIIQEWSAL
jgi:hypothetical protein